MSGVFIIGARAAAEIRDAHTDWQASVGAAHAFRGLQFNITVEIDT